MLRLLPVIVLTAAAMAYVVHVEGPGLWSAVNTLPMLVVIVLAAIALWRGRGRFSGDGWRWTLGTAGFAVPAVGLSLYLHYAWDIDLAGMASEAGDPGGLFRYLPAYTFLAGAVGFAIGWIVGRNL